MGKPGHRGQVSVEQQKGTVIDFLVVSKGTPFQLEPDNHPQTAIHSDHRPLGMMITARTSNRQARRKTFEQTLTQRPGYAQRIPASFQPANQGEYFRKMRTLQLDSLHDLARAIKDCAAGASSQVSAADKKKKGPPSGP